MARAKILERIRQLREKTAERGCTEAEAMAAAAKAAELMAKHGLAEEDLVIEEAASMLSPKPHSALRKLWAVIAVCTNTVGLNMTGARSNTILFIGVAPGPDIAAYLRDVCYNAAKRELGTFKAGTFYRRRRNTMTRKAAVADFLDAFVDRLGSRLLDLFEQTLSDTTLQLAKDFTARNHRTTSVDFRDRETRFSEAAWAGRSAGGRVHVGHGVGGGTDAPRQIGRTP